MPRKYNKRSSTVAKKGSKVSKPMVSFVKKEIRKLAAPIQIARSMSYTNAITIAATSTVPAQILLNPGQTNLNYFNSQSAWTTSGGSYLGNVLGHQFDMIKMKSLHMRLVHYTPITAPFIVRFLLVYCKMTKGSIPALSNVLDLSDSISSLYNYNAIDFDKRYKVLWDKTSIFVHNQTPSYSGSLLTNNNNQQQPAFFQKKFNLRNLTTNYQLANGGTAADIDDGMLMLYILTDSSTSAPFYINAALEYSDFQKADRHM